MLHRSLLHRSHLPRRLGAASALALVAVLAVGCGSDNSSEDNGGDSAGGDSTSSSSASGSSSIPPLMTTDQAQAGTISQENLGAGWTESAWTAHGDYGPLEGTCLAGLADLDKNAHPQLKVGTSFDYGSNDVPSLQSTVSDYADEQSVVDVMDQSKQVVEQCPSVTAQMSSNISWTFTPKVTEATPPEGVDQLLEVDFDGTATASSDGSTTPLDAHYSLFRIGNVYGKISYLSFGPDPAMSGALESIAIAKLQAAIAGDPAPATTAPDPTAA